MYVIWTLQRFLRMDIHSENAKVGGREIVEILSNQLCHCQVLVVEKHVGTLSLTALTEIQVNSPGLFIGLHSIQNWFVPRWYCGQT